MVWSVWWKLVGGVFFKYQEENVVFQTYHVREAVFRVRQFQSLVVLV